MISEAKKRAGLPWVPMAFCAFLAVVTVAANLGLSFANGSDVGGGMIAFLCFLPMCFYFVGAATSQMQAEIVELRRQVAELQGGKGASS